MKLKRYNRSNVSNRRSRLSKEPVNQDGMEMHLIIRKTAIGIDKHNDGYDA